MSMKAAAAASASRRRPRIAGGAAGWRRREEERSALAVCSTARAGRGGCRGCSRPSSQERICAADGDTGWGPRLFAGATGYAHSTVWKVLARHGLSRPPSAAREPAQPLRVALPRRSAAHGRQRATRASSGPDTRSPAIARSATAAGRTETRVGYDFAHAIVDDHSRLGLRRAASDDETRSHRTAFLERALAFFAEHGIDAKRLMTDNACSYVKNRSLRELLAATRDPPPHHPALPAPHQRQGRALPPDHGPRMGLRPRLPLTPTPSRALPHWLDHYNQRRPHSSLGGRPPISRVHNVCGQDS